MTATDVALSDAEETLNSVPSNSFTIPPLIFAARVMVTCTAGSGICPEGAGSVIALGETNVGDEAATSQYPVLTVAVDSVTPSDPFSGTAAVAEAAAADQFGAFEPVVSAPAPASAAASAAFCSSLLTVK